VENFNATRINSKGDEYVQLVGACRCMEDLSCVRSPDRQGLRVATETPEPLNCCLQQLHFGKVVYVDHSHFAVGRPIGRVSIRFVMSLVYFVSLP